MLAVFSDESFRGVFVSDVRLTLLVALTDGDAAGWGCGVTILRSRGSWRRVVTSSLRALVQYRSELVLVYPSSSLDIGVLVIVVIIVPVQLDVAL